MLLELRKRRKCIRGSDRLLQIYGYEDRFRHQAFLVSICPGSEGNEKKDGEAEQLRDELARETRRRKEAGIEILKLQLALKELKLQVERDGSDDDRTKTPDANKGAGRAQEPTSSNCSSSID
jgi:hypothetical protein